MKEIEVKFLGCDLGELRASLQSLGAVRQGRCFERNVVLDTPERRLKSENVLLRLRQAGKGVLTVKCPSKDGADPGRADDPVAFKIREEIETLVGDVEVMERALGALGFVPAFAYEKVRETWTHRGVAVCLDTLPFGFFVELEGDKESIAACARDLGLDPAASSDATYYELNLARLREQGREPEESFVFTPEQRRALEADTDLSAPGMVDT